MKTNGGILGRTIRAIRERLGETTAEMAEKLEVTPSTLVDFEDGTDEPLPRQVDRFREVYGIHLWTAYWSLFGDNTKLPASVQRAASALTAHWDQRLAEGLEVPRFDPHDQS